MPKNIPKDLKKALIQWEVEMSALKERHGVFDERGNAVDLKNLDLISTARVFDSMRKLLDVSHKYIYR